MVIYKTTNLINGKFYIGKDTRNLKCYLGSGELLKRAIDKYGKENFKKEILEFCDNLSELDSREKFWIKELKAIENGYNLTEGGTGGDTFTNNPNKELIRDTLEKRVYSDDVKQKRIKNLIPFQKGENHPNFGKKQTDETKNKRKEKFLKNGYTSPMFGKNHTEESKEKNRQKHLGKKLSEETKQKMRESAKNVILIDYICPFCGKEGKGNSMLLWHFENCKLKKNI
jgi:group I intron endonuclease